MFGMEKGKMVGLPHHQHGEKEKMFTRFNTIHEHGDDGGHQSHGVTDTSRVTSQAAPWTSV